MCIDYRRLNKKIIKDRYPLPLIEDQLDRLQGAKLFPTLDLKNGFFHVPINEESKKYTAFIVPDGTFEFNKVPFGLCNSPAVFQRYVNNALRDVIEDGTAIVYMDDIIIPSPDIQAGIEQIKRVLKVSSEAGLEINWEKCCFLVKKVEFLGHIIENGSVRPSERKTDAVQRFSEPRNIQQLQSFLGLNGYFRKFIPGYSVIERPLTQLLRSDVKFHFGPNEKQSFQQLKAVLVAKPVLSLYRVGAETELYTDASKLGYGAILLQKNSEDQKLHPIYYASGKTSPAEEKYTSYELEVLAIVKALKKFRVYLLGIEFKIVTDCRAFTLTMSKRDLCVRVARWALSLEEFRYTIEHRPGKSMTHVNALSRNPLPSCLVVDECEVGLLAALRRAQQDDPELQELRVSLEKKDISGYVLRGGLMFKEDAGEAKLIVPKRMQTQIIRRAHDQGHFSTSKTEALIKSNYWMPNLKSKVELVIRSCVSCILAERKTGKQECFLTPIEKGCVPMDTYHIDHLGPLPSTKKSYQHILVVIDAFSMFTWMFAVKSTSAADVISRLSKMSTTFGNPRRIISDRGTAFTSREFANYCDEQNIEHSLIVTGVPRGNGQVERVNRTVIPLLTKLSAPKSAEWYKHLHTAQLYLNTTTHRSIATSAFNVFLGIRPRVNDNPEIRELLENEFIHAVHEERDELRAKASENIKKIQEENRRTFNKKRKEANVYKMGDLVAIKRTQQGPGTKFAHKNFGPYEISKVLRNHRYLVHKVGEHEGPMQTSTSVDFMKPWINYDDHDLSDCDGME